MSESNWTAKAAAFVERLLRDAAPGARAIELQKWVEWYPDLLRTLSEHKMAALRPGGDIVVFFDASGQVKGWRDDGRLGAAVQVNIDKDVVVRAAVDELELPANTRAGVCRGVELPPVGWTMEIVLFPPANSPHPPLIRAWVSPQTQRVVQVLFGESA